MKRTYNIGLVTMLGVAFLCVASTADGQDGAVTPGGVAPDFMLGDTHGENHALSDYRGEWVVLEWLNYGCPYVRKHYDSGNMQSLQEKYGELV